MTPEAYALSPPSAAIVSRWIRQTGFLPPKRTPSYPNTQRVSFVRCTGAIDGIHYPGKVVAWHAVNEDWVEYSADVLLHTLVGELVTDGTGYYPAIRSGDLDGHPVFIIITPKIATPAGGETPLTVTHDPSKKGRYSGGVLVEEISYTPPHGTSDIGGGSLSSPFDWQTLGTGTGALGAGVYHITGHCYVDLESSSSCNSGTTTGLSCRLWNNTQSAVASLESGLALIFNNNGVNAAGQSFHGFADFSAIVEVAENDEIVFQARATANSDPVETYVSSCFVASDGYGKYSYMNWHRLF